jgi:hypothetical protein
MGKSVNIFLLKEWITPNPAIVKREGLKVLLSGLMKCEPMNLTHTLACALYMGIYLGMFYFGKGLKMETPSRWPVDWTALPFARLSCHPDGAWRGLINGVSQLIQSTVLTNYLFARHRR